MADNDTPNRHGRKPPNGQNDDAFEAIERIGRRASHRSAEERAERERLRRADESLQGLEELVERDPNTLGIKSISRALREDREARKRLGPKLRLRTEARRERAIDESYNAIQREYSSRTVNAQASGMTDEEDVQQRALGMMGMGSRELKTARRGIMSSLGALEQSSVNIAQNQLYGREGQQDPSALAELRANYRKRALLVSRLGSIEAAEKQKRSIGEDVESRTTDLLRMGQKARNTLFKGEVSDELASGKGLGALSGDDLKRKEAEAANAVVAALEKLKNSAGASADTIDKLKEDAEEAGKELKRTQEAISQGGKGGGGGTNWLGIAAAGFGAAGAAIQNIGVNQRLASTSNIQGYAEYENSKYSAYKAAASGDIAAMMQLQQFGAAEDFGGGLKTAANAAVTAQAAGAGAQIAMGVGAMGGAANPLSWATNTSGQALNVGAGAQNVLEGTATAAVAVSDLAQGISGRQADLAGRNARLAAMRAVSAVPAEQLQGFKNFTQGVSNAAINLGANGEDYIQQSLSNKNMEDMVKARISPEQFSQLAAIGSRDVGSTFNNNQIFAARGLERSGFGSMQENMSRMTSLASAGANNPRESLGAALEVSFTKSLNSAKSLTDLVQNTAAMAGSSTGRMAGLDVTAAQARLIGGAIDSNDPNKEFAVKRAASVAELANQIGTNTGVNYAGMVATARIGRSTGLTGVQRILAQGLDDATLQTLGGMGAKEQVDFLRKKGINSSEGSVTSLVQTLTKDRQMTLLEAGGKGFAVNMNREEVLNKIRKGGYSTLSQQEQLQVGQVAGLAGFASGEDYSNYIRGVGKLPDQKAKDKAAAAMAGEGGGALQTQLQDVSTLGAKQLATQAKAAAEQLGGAEAATKKLIEAFAGLEKHVTTATEKNFSGAAARSAATGGDGMNVTAFNTGAQNLLSAANALLRQAGLPVPDNKEKKSAPGG